MSMGMRDAPARRRASAWWTGLLTTLMAVPALAQAPQGDRVALWPLANERLSEEDANAVTTLLRAQLEALVEDRVVPAAQTDAVRARPEAGEFTDCISEVRCAVGLGQLLEAGQVMTGVVRMEGETRAVELRLVDVTAQRETGRVGGTLPDTEHDRAAVLKELAARLVAPERHQGTLVINGIDSGVTVLVDGEKQVVDASAPSLRVPLRVGKHNVEIRRGGPVLNEVVDIRFEEIMVLMAPAAPIASAAPAPASPVAGTTPPPGTANAVVTENTPHPERTLRIPVWVGPLVMALAIPPLLAGLVFAVDLFFIGPLALLNPSECQPWTATSDNGQTGLNPRANPGNACGSFWRYTARRETGVAPVLALDVTVLAISGLLALGAVAVGGLLLVAALTPPLEDVDAARAGKPAARRMTAVQKTGE